MRPQLKRQQVRQKQRAWQKRGHRALGWQDLPEEIVQISAQGRSTSRKMSHRAAQNASQSKALFKEKRLAALRVAMVKMAALSVVKASQRGQIEMKWALERERSGKESLRKTRETLLSLGNTGNQAFDIMRNLLLLRAWPEVLFINKACDNLHVNQSDADIFCMWNNISTKVQDRFMETLNKSPTAARLVFHGTQTCVHASIREHGLLVPTAHDNEIHLGIRNGNAMGPGIYTSDLLSTAQRYAAGGSPIVCCAAITENAKTAGAVHVIPTKEEIVPLCTVKFGPEHVDKSCRAHMNIASANAQLRYGQAAREYTVRHSERRAIWKKHHPNHKAAVKMKRGILKKKRSRARGGERRAKVEERVVFLA